jgi:hypothetical protein
MALTTDEIDLLVSTGQPVDGSEAASSPVHAVSGLPRLRAYGTA